MSETGDGLCAARFNGHVPCSGRYVPSEGLCFRHAVLFDVWIANGGWQVYDFNPPESPVRNRTIGILNPPRLRRWKRAQFHQWLNRLTLGDVEQIMKS